MKITEIYGVSRQSDLKKSKNKETSQGELSHSASSGEKAGAETVHLSSTARDVQKAAKIASGTPDIRVEKVMEIKDRIEKGEYNVSGEEIANKMLKDLMLM